MKKVLYVTSKWVYPTDSNDGGDSTVSEIISSINSLCQLDVLSFRAYDENNIKKIPFINKFFFQKMDFANYYLQGTKDKFLIRVKLTDISAKKISSMANNYDIIIIQHCMFLLNLCKYYMPTSKKVILLPMFTSTSYKKSQDDVPNEYLEAEKQGFKYVSQIITPSNIEKETLIKDYKFPSEKITIIPRPICGIKFKERTPNKNIQLIYIASMRHQKSHIEAMKLMKILKTHIPNIKLHCVGTIQDGEILNNCTNFLNENELINSVIFHDTLSHEKLCELLNECDINISVSHWETFGRGIFEGLASGLPTVVLSRIKSIFDFPIHMRPLVAKDINDMAKIIINLIEDKELFIKESLKGKYIQDFLSFEKIKKNLAETILS